MGLLQLRLVALDFLLRQCILHTGGFQLLFCFRQTLLILLNFLLDERAKLDYPEPMVDQRSSRVRVMTAFKQVVGKLQQGNREEAIIGLEFVLRGVQLLGHFRHSPDHARRFILNQRVTAGCP